MIGWNNRKVGLYDELDDGKDMLIRVCSTSYIVLKCYNRRTVHLDGDLSYSA